MNELKILDIYYLQFPVEIINFIFIKQEIVKITKIHSKSTK